MLTRESGVVTKEVAELISALKLVVFDFDGVFTDNRVMVSDGGTESVMCCRSDGLGLRRLRELGIDMFILSTETNPVVSVRARKLELECIHGCENKLRALEAEAERRGISLVDTAFVGNDINDLDCLKNVGLPVVVADAYDEVRGLARIVLSRSGGYGAVREFCDLVYATRKGVL